MSEDCDRLLNALGCGVAGIDSALTVVQAKNDYIAELEAQIEEQNRKLEAFHIAIPQTYGEVKQLTTDWPPCEDHEWDNRTTAENAAWCLFTVIAQSRQIAQLNARIAALTAPLMQTCPICEGNSDWGKTEHLPSPECPCCHGAKQIPDPRIAEIRKRAEAATPGPWNSHSGGSAFAPAYRLTAGIGIVAYCEVARINSDNDFSFAANARTDIPYMLDRLTALAAENAELKEKNAQR